MKASGFKPCAICGKGVMHSGIPLFYRVQIESMCVDPAAFARRVGMEQMMGGGFGGALLAEHMGPNEDIAKPIDPKPPAPILICQPCALESRPLLLLSDSKA